ncbi:hypothetical protein CGZ90_12850 [Fictibacillus aquaticus]|uniref:Uncharacterized protein n=1 Tax=Fictibacillus aquaticus TaxID=2021314 RepID=A0A235F962_9BACL|nr:hypothetical protein CGZ90_12850 [Fictibacillus aquaticus]
MIAEMWWRRRSLEWRRLKVMWRGRLFERRRIMKLAQGRGVVAQECILMTQDKLKQAQVKSRVAQAE